MTSGLRASRDCILRIVLVLLLLLAFLPRVQAQLTALPPLSAHKANTEPSAPALNKPVGAHVTFDNRTLFTLYANTPEQARDRADLVNFRLSKAFREIKERGEPPSCKVQMLDANPVITLNESPLLTITPADAAMENETAAQLAYDWADKIEEAFATAMRERRPEYRREAALKAVKIVLVAVLITLFVRLVMRRLFHRTDWPTLIFIWLIAVNRIFALFPLTRPLFNIVRTGVLRPLSIFLIVALAAMALSHILTAVLQQLFPPIPEPLSPGERTKRSLRRRATLGAAARITGVTLIWMLAVIVALSWSGIDLRTSLTSAGLIGVAIGLAAQDTMKDLVAGVNILTDDRFGVGDIVRIGDYQGTVETVNLRITQIRDISGRLITFPNRTVEVVANLTSRWAQVDFSVRVVYETDLRTAMAVMLSTAETLREEWSERILDAPQMLGTDAYSETGILLRMLVRTLPGEQWEVARELRLRIKEAFDCANITIAFPHVVAIASV